MAISVPLNIHGRILTDSDFAARLVCVIAYRDTYVSFVRIKGIDDVMMLDAACVCDERLSRFSPDGKRV